MPQCFASGRRLGSTGGWKAREEKQEEGEETKPLHTDGFAIDNGRISEKCPAISTSQANYV